MQSTAPLAATEVALAEVVEREEATRAVAFSRIAMFMVTLVAVQLPWLGGDPHYRNGAAVALVVMFLTSAWSYARGSKPGGYTPRVFRVQGYTMATCILPIVAYMGFFSPVTVVLSLGIYYLGQSRDRKHALLMALYITTAWVLGCLLIMTGVVEDRGLYSTRGVELLSQTLMVSGVGFSMLTTLWLANIARGSLRDAIMQANQALLVAQKRDALLQEAHSQLDRAMRVSIGKPGIHTGELAGEYLMAEIIGIGAMGEVYAAEHTGSGERAAVKLLHSDALRREDMIVRFLREASVCTRFQHPNLVRVHDVGRMDDGAPYMVMERLTGEHLSAVLRARGHLSLREVLALSESLGAGLAHAHHHGVVHRDLKPQNIVQVDGSGRPAWKILDFGISKLVDAGATLTGDGGVLGTPAYMSPEQARGLEVDARSDIFAMGSVLYRALTGQPAFPGRDTPQIMFAVAYVMPARPSTQVRDLDPDVDLVLALALAKEPEERIADPQALTDALRSAIAGSLDASLRARAARILSRRPWGHTPEAK